MDKKITSYFLKLLRSKSKYARGHVVYTYDDENYYLCDGYFLRAVKKEEMELNINLFKETKSLNEVLEGVKDEKYKEAKIKYYVPDKYNKGKFIIKIANKETKAYINSKYLELFKDCTKFKIISELKAVVCLKEEKDKEIFLGLIMPIRVEEEY
ncbi:hypothetical protein [Clostridium beijerinckii]|uniref:hypothetical protein n=1 Tax=Clostridium beijerinckii TaxID=1520 RepID=UPI001F405899|nr:hypothetical protein [Clostridium beijerinckii]